MSDPGNTIRFRAQDNTDIMTGINPTQRDYINFIPREGLGNDLFVQCQDHLQVINMATEHQLTIKNEMKKFIKLERAIAFKKNNQAERISEILGGNSSTVSNPVWFIRSIQSVASRLVQQAKCHCCNTEKLSRFCSGIQDLVDNHFRVMKSVYEEEYHNPPPSPQPKADDIARPRLPRKKTTERKPEGAEHENVFLSPPPTSRKPKDAAVPEEPKGTVEDFYQANVTFEGIRKKRLAFSNRVEYLKLQQESISGQLEETNAIMAGLTDVKTGKMQQWTAQSRLADVRSRRDFLQQNKKQIEEETRISVLELYEFDSNHRCSMEQIHNIFESTKTKYERLLQNSICALESVVSSDVNALAQTETACADRIYIMKSNLWETFDDKHQRDEAKGSYGDGRSGCNNDASSQSSCLSMESTQAGRVDKDAQLYKSTDKKSQVMKEKVSRKKSVSKSLDPVGGILLQSPSPNISDSTSEETIVLGKDSIRCLPSSKNSRFTNPFNGDINCTSGRRSTQSVNNKPSNENATKLRRALKTADGGEDRTNNHDVEMVNRSTRMSAETPEEIPTDDSPNIFLIYSKRGKPVCHSRCSNISRNDLNALDRDSAREKEEDEAINKYFDKYLLRLGRCGMHSFESRRQRIQSWPEMFLSDKKVMDEKVAQPILITLSKESKEKFEVCTMSQADMCDHNIESHRQLGLCISKSNSSDPCSENESSEWICLNNLSRDETSIDEPRGLNPKQSDVQEYNISNKSKPEEVSSNHNHKNNIGISQNEEEMFHSQGDCNNMEVHSQGDCTNMEANIKQNSNEPDIIPSDCFDADRDEGRPSGVSYCQQPGVHRVSHGDGVNGSHAYGDVNVTEQINSFLALMAKETQAVLKKIESECSNMSNSDSESPSTVTSLSCSSTTTGVYCPDAIPRTGSTNGGQHLGQDNKCKSSSCHKRVRFSEEIEYSAELEQGEERDFSPVLGDDLNDYNNTADNDNNSDKTNNKNENKIDNNNSNKTNEENRR